MPCLDSFARPINYLRVSVTDRCNLRCVYCMPAEGIDLVRHEDVLRYEEIARVVQAAAALGVCKVRLTGGEPLARRGLPDLVRLIAAVPGIDDISMTTNGVLLPRHADALAAAGLRRVNVSLDSLRPNRFRAITRCGELTDVWAGIAAAERAGLTPVKLNTVVARGLNDDEVVDFARLTLEQPLNVRFIEIMPLGANEHWAGDGYVPMSEVRARIEAALGPLETVRGHDPVVGNGPARYSRVPGAPGTIGFISPVSEHFCFHCNRLRLTADGKLRPCLLSDDEIDLRAALRGGADDQELETIIAQAIAAKPARHHLDVGDVPHARQMAQIGG
ncbi:MAG: GTP 3',8-cyclase MoaA [Chloroflexi bacterium]|nr:GTP 3',8-cyclase MoaA [Chloroflexota bacterium]MBU1748239.1 GTP 3',8-cyclase MoaA [Chloroflexota bacterium]